VWTAKNASTTLIKSKRRTITCSWPANAGRGKDGEEGSEKNGKQKPSIEVNNCRGDVEYRGKGALQENLPSFKVFFSLHGNLRLKKGAKTGGTQNGTKT